MKRLIVSLLLAMLLCSYAFAEQAGNIITFGHYEKDADSENGQEPIEWIVLDEKDGKYLLLSLYGLDAKSYDSSANNMTWEKCTLRKWLNNDFLQAAFSAEEQKQIILTKVDNSKKQGYRKWKTNGGKDTEDRIFLLSCAEAQQYLGVVFGGDFNSDARMIPTAYALKNGACFWKNLRDSDDKNLYGSWWLRSPGYVQNAAANVGDLGVLVDCSISNDEACVRPVLWVNSAYFSGKDEVMQREDGHNVTTEEESKYAEWILSLIEEYKAQIHDPHYDSNSADPFTAGWREYVDDPRSEPAYAVLNMNEQPALLIGDCADPTGMVRRVYQCDHGDICCAAESTADETWYLLTDGNLIRKENIQNGEVMMEISWIRFWESKKAIVAGEDKGGLISRNGLDQDSYTLGKQETGLVVVVDEVTDGWAWYRYRATRKGFSASSFGYMPNSGLIYPELSEPIGTGAIAKNGRTSGKATINVRFRPTTRARKILELPLGTEVDVYGSENGWTEIEWNRWHGFIKDEFLIR